MYHLRILVLALAALVLAACTASPATQQSTAKPAATAAPSTATTSLPFGPIAATPTQGGILPLLTVADLKGKELKDPKIDSMETTFLEFVAKQYKYTLRRAPEQVVEFPFAFQYPEPINDTLAFNTFLAGKTAVYYFTVKGQRYIMPLFDMTSIKTTGPVKVGVVMYLDPPVIPVRMAN